MARTFRRVVTGHNADGRSIILNDGPPPQTVEPLPQLVLHEIWETAAQPSLKLFLHFVNIFHL